MNIQWIAHSCFKITLENGTELLFDPFDSYIGYEMPALHADIVLISHEHEDHNCLRNIEGDYALVKGPGKREVKGIQIEGFETCHDHSGGAHRGKNTVFKVEADNMSVVHLGDLGCIPGDDFFEKLGAVDILCVPVGGNYTIDAQEAFEVCKRIEPNIILPMHYKTLFLKLDVAPVYAFTDLASDYYDRSRLGRSSFSIDAAGKKKRTRINILENSLDC